jgi:hypothetical protein
MSVCANSIRQVRATLDQWNACPVWVSFDQLASMLREANTIAANAKP